MKSCLLKIAVYADVIKNGETVTFSLDDRHYRTGIKLCDILAYVLGCQYQVVHSEDGGFGSFSNGSWTGLVGMVYRGDADFAVSEIAITQERWKVIDFSYPFSVSEVTFITEQLQIIHSLATVLDPFSWEVWSYFGLFQITVPFIFYFLFLKRHSFSKIALKTFSTFLGQQGFTFATKTSRRALIIIWSISMMIMSLTYKANLLSILTFPIPDGVRIIPELAAEVEKGNYKCTAYPGSFYADDMLKSGIRRLEIIGQDIHQNKGSSNIEKTLENIGNKKSAFIGALSNFIHLKNKYFISEDCFFIELPAIAMRKGCPYKRKVDTAIHRIYAGGLFERILEEERFFKVVQNLADLGAQDAENVKALTLKHVYSAFFVLLIGHILAFCCFIIELLSGRNRRTNYMLKTTTTTTTKKKQQPGREINF